jgi:hypothetical protein
MQMRLGQLGKAISTAAPDPFSTHLPATRERANGGCRRVARAFASVALQVAARPADVEVLRLLGESPLLNAEPAKSVSCCLRLCVRCAAGCRTSC